MRKDLALAVLWAAVNLTAPFNLDATPFDQDDDADDAIECVEFSREGTAGLRVLDLASQACGEWIDSAWVARQAAGPPAAAAVQQTSPHVALINLTIDAPPEQHSSVTSELLGQALDHCRDHGALKVLIDPQGIPTAVVRNIAELHGYQFSRLDSTTKPATIEFYTDLYWHPKASRS
jgi:hypothetical protein